MEVKSYIEKIITCEDENKKDKMWKYISHFINTYNQDDKEEIIRGLYELAEGKVLNEERAKYLIENMKPYGMKWDLQTTESVRSSNGYDDIRPVDFWIVMNSAYNDYNDIFKEDVSLYARFSRDFIKDEDAVEDKVYYYFSMIPKD